MNQLGVPDKQGADRLICYLEVDSASHWVRHTLRADTTRPAAVRRCCKRYSSRFQAQECRHALHISSALGVREVLGLHERRCRELDPVHMSKPAVRSGVHHGVGATHKKHQTINYDQHCIDK